MKASNTLLLLPLGITKNDFEAQVEAALGQEEGEEGEAREERGGAGETESIFSDEGEGSVCSDVTAETVDSVNTAQQYELNEEVMHAREEEERERRERKRGGRAAVKKWCDENFINRKTIDMVESTRRDLLHAVRDAKIFNGHQVHNYFFSPFLLSFSSLLPPSPPTLLSSLLQFTLCAP